MAVFEYRDAWALLEPAADPRGCAPGGEGSASSTLAFSVPLAPNPDAAPGGTAGLDQAEVFVRLRLAALTSVPGEPVRRSAAAGAALPDGGARGSPRVRVPGAAGHDG